MKRNIENVCFLLLLFLICWFCLAGVENVRVVVANA